MKKYKLNDQVLQQIKELWDNGFGTRPISKKLGLCRATIQKAYDILKIENRMSRVPEIKLDESMLSKIKDLWDKKWGSRRIGKELKLTRATVKRAFEKLNIDSSNRKTPKSDNPIKFCPHCQQNKPRTTEHFDYNEKSGFKGYCIECTDQYSLNRSSNKRKSEIGKYNGRCHENNNLTLELDNDFLEIVKVFYDQNNGFTKISKLLNVKISWIMKAFDILDLWPEKGKLKTFLDGKICKQCNIYFKINEFNTLIKGPRTILDDYCKICAEKINEIKKINGKIRRRISNIIHRHLLDETNEYSCLEFLEYTMPELKLHIELLFEDWMNWSNWKIYDPNTWDDGNCLTWTWNLDHIIPQAKLLYISMNDDNFKKCWALENLRPLSAKQNILDGLKTRHGKDRN